MKERNIFAVISVDKKSLNSLSGVFLLPLEIPDYIYVFDAYS